MRIMGPGGSNHCLKALCQLIEEEKFESVALPRLATGVGGLDPQQPDSP